MAGEQLADDGFYKTNKASEVIVEIAIADAFYAFVKVWIAKSTGYCRIRSRRTTASRPYVSRFVCDLHDKLKFSAKTLSGQKLTSGNYLQCNRKILPDRKPKLIPTQANYPLGNLGQKVCVTATNILIVSDKF